MEIDKILFRASGVGKIMVEPRSKSELLSETAKDYLIDVLLDHKYGRVDNLTNKYVIKGHKREDDSITIVSRYMKRMFTKNTTRLNNEFLTGEPDLFEGASIDNATHTIDTKTSWSMSTFWRSKKALDKMYYWQGQAYMALTGAKKHTVAFCLVNGTIENIINEKNKARYALNIIDPDTENEEYNAMCRQIEINHIFDIQAFLNEHPWFEFHNDVNNWSWDVPWTERIHTFTIDRDDVAIESMYNKIKFCREYIKQLTDA